MPSLIKMETHRDAQQFGGEMDGARNQNRAKAFSRWFLRYRKDVMTMSQAEFGNYMKQFIIYLLKLEGTNLTERDRESAQGRLRGELTEMARGFEIESRYSDSKMNESWTKLFLVFCITGDIYSNYNPFDYLDTNDDGQLPKNAWVRKDIPLIAINTPSPTQGLRERAQIPETKRTKSVNTQQPMTTNTTISDLLRVYVRKEIVQRGTTQDSVLRSLADEMNEDGADFVRMELELILNAIDNSSYFGRVRSMVKRFGEMEIFLKGDETPYSVAELLSMPLGFEFIEEESRKPQRSR
jgi:hypothetical protein